MKKPENTKAVSYKCVKTPIQSPLILKQNNPTMNEDEFKPSLIWWSVRLNGL